MPVLPIPPLCPHVHFGFEATLPEDTLFFGSGRQALHFLARRLLEQHYGLLFVVPAYTCETVMQAIGEAGGALAFVDIDDSLDFRLADLDSVLDAHPGRQPVLLPTALFGAPVRDYKALFPGAIVVEDRCQTLQDAQSSADFQLLSFGKGKLVTGAGGGALVGDVAAWREAHARLPQQAGVWRHMAAAWLLRHVVLQSGWRFLEDRLGALSPLPDVVAELPAIRPQAINPRRARWIMQSMRRASLAVRKEWSQTYHERLPARLRFDIPADLPYLRYPVRALLQLPGASSGRMYEPAWRMAEAARGVDLPGAASLVHSSLLPTHELVRPEHLRLYLSSLQVAAFWATWPERAVTARNGPIDAG